MNIKKKNFVATRTILIPSHICKPVVEAVGDHFLKRSLRLKNINNIQTEHEHTQTFTPRGSQGTITLILPLVVDKATCLLLVIEPLSLVIFHFLLLPFISCIVVIIVIVIDCYYNGSFSVSVSQFVIVSCLQRTTTILIACALLAVVRLVILKIAVRNVKTGLAISATMWVSIQPSCLPSIKRSVRGKPRPLPLQGFPPLCMSPCVTCHPQCVEVL